MRLNCFGNHELMTVSRAYADRNLQLHSLLERRCQESINLIQPGQ